MMELFYLCPQLYLAAAAALTGVFAVHWFFCANNQSNTSKELDIDDIETGKAPLLLHEDKKAPPYSLSSSLNDLIAKGVTAREDSTIHVADDGAKATNFDSTSMDESAGSVPGPPPLAHHRIAYESSSDKESDSNDDESSSDESSDGDSTILSMPRLVPRPIYDSSDDESSDGEYTAMQRTVPRPIYDSSDDEESTLDGAKAILHSSPPCQGYRYQAAFRKFDAVHFSPPCQGFDGNAEDEVMTDVDINDERHAINLNYLLELLKQGKDAGEKIKGKDVLLLVSSTGAGKTPAALYLAGTKFEEWAPMDHYEPIELPNQDLTPGFGDTKGTEMDTSNGLAY